MLIKKLLLSLVQYISVIPFLGLAALAAGTAMGPAIYFFDWMSPSLNGLQPYLYYPSLGILIVVCYSIYGLSLIFIAPLLNFIFRGRLKPWRGSAVSLGCIPWYVHSCFTLVVRLSFLEFITPTPFNILFYRLMGMKIGQNVTINSTAIADPSLIELGDGVMIGGSASIMAHYAQGANLVISPVKIGARATIGLRAIILGGVEIGERATVLAGSYVLPKTVIPAKETWGGVPARKVDIRKFREELDAD